ncbi:uncharacterized protein V1518DRAFT_408327 [Limtongia smithiae]|uniref:uncharacterized protein n=1 Tax=Limtongia smithiae TaxID=1125753 RepID=UPI0034CEE724
MSADGDQEDEGRPLLGALAAPAASAPAAISRSAQVHTPVVTPEIRASTVQRDRHAVAIPPVLGPPKIGPQRTSKIAQKLTVLPESGRSTSSSSSSSSSRATTASTPRPSPPQTVPVPERGPHDEQQVQSPQSPSHPYAPHSPQQHPQQQRQRQRRRRDNLSTGDTDDFYRDPEILGKADRAVLPRVTAYCTASSYLMKEMLTYFTRHCEKVGKPKPHAFTDCFYMDFAFERHQAAAGAGEVDYISRRTASGVEVRVGVPRKKEAFVFEYGVVVLWGFTMSEEQQFLNALTDDSVEVLEIRDRQVEDFGFFLTLSHRPRVFNDYIALGEGEASNYMVKLSLSHAIAQSVKISLFEGLISNTINRTKDMPQNLAMTGKVHMTRREVMMSIGELFILRININLHSSIIDSPELMWTEPQLEPLYKAMRSYLEIGPRVTVLNQRLEVIADLLEMMKEQLGHTHEEYLELVVIVLIAVEIVVAVTNIVVDMAAEAGAGR